MQPTDYPPGRPVQPHAAVLPTATPTQTDQPAENTIENMFSVFQAATREFFGELEVSAAYAFNSVTSALSNAFFEQPSLLILPKDMLIHQVFTKLTSDKDLLALTRTCISLYDMRALQEFKLRIPCIQIIPLFGMQFGQKGTELILATNKRPLDHSESIAAGVPHLTLEATKEQIHAELNIIRLETEFYDLFKERCAQLNINPGCVEFVDYSATAVKNLNKKPASLNIVSDCMSIKLKTITNNFCGKIFHDIVDTYAKQPIANLTPGYFKAKVAELQAFFPMNPIAPIEAALRRAIRTPANSAEMKMLAAGYSDPTSPKFAELKQALKAELQLCKVETQAKIGKLCGNNFNGTIHDAYCVKIAAKAELDTALAECRHAFGAFPGASDQLATLLGFDITNAYAPLRMEAARADLVAKNDMFIVTKAVYNKLCAELNTLAVWTFGNITGGAIFEIETKLGNFDRFVQAEATKLGQFYDELSNEVLPGKEDASSAALHETLLAKFIT